MAYFDNLISVKFISKSWKIKGRVQGELWQGFFKPDLVGNVLKLQRKIVAYFDKLISVKFISKSEKD